MKKNVSNLISCCLLINIATNAQNGAIEKKVNDLLKKMTLDEKIGQLNQYSGKLLTGPANSTKTNLQKEIKNGLVGSMLKCKRCKRHTGSTGVGHAITG